MFFIIVEYFKFLKKSTNQHGVHSPFVFNLVTKCLYKRPTKEQKEFYRKIYQRLADSKQDISVNDFGAGSKVFNSNLQSSFFKKAIISIALMALISAFCFFVPVSITVFRNIVNHTVYISYNTCN